MKRAIVLFIGVLLVSTGCTVTRENVYNIPKLPIKQLGPKKIKEQTKSESGIKQKKYTIIYVPTIRVRQPKEKAAKLTGKRMPNKREFELKVNNMSLINFINLVFGKILKVNYSVDSSVRRLRFSVTFNMTKPANKSDFLGIVLSILEQYNITVEERNGVYFIHRGFSLRNKGASVFFYGRSLPENLLPTERVGILVPLYYIKAKNYSGVLRNLALSRRGLVEVLPKRNYLFIIDYANYVKSALRYITLLDRPFLAKRIAALVRFSYILPSEFVKKMKEILPYEGIPISNTVSEPGIVLKPLDDLSYVLVVSPKREWLRIIYFWRDKLDNLSSLGSQPRLFVFYPKNRRASDLAKILSGLKNLNLKPGIKKKGTLSVSLSDVNFTVDEGRNALVIFCKPFEYKQIKEVLEKLDVLPKQVYVQVTILEVTLTGKLDYGIEWYLRHTGRYNGMITTVGGLGLGVSGLTYSVITNTGKFNAIINAFAKKDLVNVLSSPSLIVMNNKSASINVGTQVPIVTSETSSAQIQTEGTTSLLRTIEYRKTGVILNIKPTINSNGVVTMNISQEVSDAQTNNTSKIDSPLILTRDVKTTVNLRSGDTLLLGGLIKKNRSLTIEKVPILGDIPLIGNLFKTTSKGNTKTELIVEVTPYILSNFSQSGKVTSAYEKLLDLLK